MTTKELDDSMGRDTTMCGDPKTWFPMRVTSARDEGKGGAGPAGNRELCADEV